MSKPVALVVDDEPDIRELVTLTLARMDIACVCAEGLDSAFQLLDKQEYFLCLADMRLQDGDGIELVKHIQTHKPELPVAVVTAFGNVEGAVNTLKAGAFDYVSKPVNLTMLKDLVNTALQLSCQGDVARDDGLIGQSVVIEVLRKDIKKLSRSQAPVFIQGESGVGKELVANLIHTQGPRAAKPFIPVNCGAIPSELMESEFFGHKKGSFTGAVKDHIGLFQAAHGGTLFLDEVAELPMPMQVKLLRAIQEKAIKPIGDHRETPVDVRILSASHKNLLDEINAERFRQDLYYRINVIEVMVPSLRHHLDDLPLLTTAILNKLSKSHGISCPSIDAACMESLADYHFPGNVRELENILERAMTLCDDNTIECDDLQLPKLTSLQASSPDCDEQALDSFLDHQERQRILDALEHTKWNRTAAAKLLGISFRALRYRLKKLNIE